MYSNSSADISGIHILWYCTKVEVVSKDRVRCGEGQHSMITSFGGSVFSRCWENTLRRTIGCNQLPYKLIQILARAGIQ